MNNSVRFGSKVKKIEVNDVGEFVTINTSDANFYKNFKELLNWLETESAKAKKRETSTERSVLEKATESVDEFVSLSEQMNEKVDALFGARALQKAFPDTEVPTLDLGMEFVEAMIPFVNEFTRERNAQITEKYNANRKGANSK